MIEKKLPLNRDVANFEVTGELRQRRKLWRGSRSKQLQRTFKLHFDLGVYRIWAEQVLECLENPILNVFDPGDSQALRNRSTDEGVWDILARATVPIDIWEWLPVGCQSIRFQPFDDGRLACYWSNAQAVLFPPKGLHPPAGPAVFVGEILVSCGFQPRSEGAFKFVIAHELVHVFDLMRFVVPAFQDWNRFWRNVLQEGNCNEEALLVHHELNSSLDNRGIEAELDRIEEFWPSYVDAWHEDVAQYENHYV